MGHFNAWSNPSLAGEEDARRMSEFLEERSGRPDQQQVNRAVCELLAPQPGECLLEVGSGTGTVARRAADMQAEASVYGVDLSPHFAVFARRRVDEQSRGQRVHFLAGDGKALPWRDACFDAAWGVRLLLHLEEPEAVVAEMLRVVRPGGRIVLADWDFETVVLDHPDRELTRRILHWRSDHHGGDNWSGRKILRRMQQAGLRDIRMFPLTIVTQDESSALTLSLWRAAEVACQGGEITPAEQETWVGLSKERIAGGQFFASITYFLAKGYR